ncbi:hypothetical protein CEP54_012874 [Fusarium duplospermum]|uniref:NAD(P)-binding domain-containing protein n=1 Tax=Fusarium duplospermum TaxID=1325734 RepID=A0A428P680_9HYPO|nr:hypothetical protein CEP54_012874 [Fusarium duplospermum]
MYAILGAAGKVGFATLSALRKAGVPVRAILHDASKAAPLREIGCEIALADLQDSRALAKAIGDADTIQIILPPSPQAKDTAEEMQRAIESLAAALGEARPKRVLAISDYGAHITHDIGMPTMCRTFEERLRQLDCQKVFLRSAEHMQGWGRAIPAAIESGTLLSFHDPVDMSFPTISAPDLGLIAADILLQPPATRTWRLCMLKDHVGTALKMWRRHWWKGTFERAMSVTLADLLIKANDAQNEGGLVDVGPNSDKVRYGTTELVDALRPLLPPQQGDN